MSEQKKQCFFCTSSHKVLNHKDADTLRRFMSASMKIMPRRRSNLCAGHQRELARAVKRARILGLAPYTLH